MYIDTSTLEYPITKEAIKSRYSNVSFPELFVAPEPYAFVNAVIAPVYDSATQNIRELSPKLENGVWLQHWEVYQLSETEVQANIDNQWTEIRKKRNLMLQETDWTQLPDCPLTDAEKADWAVYRQSLRDVTTQADPFAIIWPVQPE